MERHAWQGNSGTVANTVASSCLRVTLTWLPCRRRPRRRSPRRQWACVLLLQVCQQVRRRTLVVRDFFSTLYYTAFSIADVSPALRQACKPSVVPKPCSTTRPCPLVRSARTARPRRRLRTPRSSKGRGSRALAQRCREVRATSGRRALAQRCLEGGASGQARGLAPQPASAEQACAARLPEACGAARAAAACVRTSRHGRRARRVPASRADRA